MAEANVREAPETEPCTLTAQGRQQLTRAQSCEDFRDLTPTGEISMRMQPRWLPRENFDRYDKDGAFQTDNRPLSEGAIPSRRVANCEEPKRQFLNRATVVHQENDAVRTVKMLEGKETRVNTAADLSRWCSDQTASVHAQGDQVFSDEPRRHF